MECDVNELKLVRERGALFSKKHPISVPYGQMLLVYLSNFSRVGEEYLPQTDSFCFSPPGIFRIVGNPPVRQPGLFSRMVFSRGSF